ncbi:acyl CoA binding protein-domain-containing protein [Talaromyces proteolyticus]|uniref:Acyl CoA binding protein-domain-containing protein n=1 Tax=Talaromyces proteolyticus TaxID=1131652 RepID=A0AAD4KZP9_9EURO|nr:acyl CoA binding protein-domain-containing protein [Talaromyces proteolyticus]KAH8704017.1 acyl CoA binding protein-domain-containing protein [Talaromyces proteolyticus]
MSDSVDRVFVHALNTVKKIPRTGTARPPTAERLKLYGLYKQSMEGDVEGIMDRPVGDAADVQAEREKWDAWYSQRGISRTEAKRRYITTLVDTMHRYASQTEEARELVSELEFVWDQIKYSTSSSSSSSPMQAMGLPMTTETSAPRKYGSIDGRMSRSPPVEDPDEDLAIYRRRLGDSRLRVLSPVSQPDEPDSNIPEEEEDDEDEEFQEARDGTSSGGTTSSQDREKPTAAKTRRRRASTPGNRPSSHNNADDWRRRVEQALTKMTTEVAALREQIESRSIYASRRRSSLLSWLKWLFWIAMRQLLWDCMILAIILIWMRVNSDRRLEQKVKAGLIQFKNWLMTLRIPRRLPKFSRLSLP